MPAFIAPCLARLAHEVAAGPDWGHEVKFDGYRIQARIEKGRVRYLTRSGLDWSKKFSGLSKAFVSLGVSSAMIDGEVVVEDERGASSFAELVGELKAGRSARMAYVAFDLLFLDGEDMRAQPLRQRKERLARLLKKSQPGGPLRFSEHLTGDGEAILAEVCKLGLEGIISKRLDAPYRSGRRDDWLKLKCLQADEFVIAGYLDSTAIKEAIGALVLGYFDGKRLIYAGRVGTGFSQRMAGQLWQELQTLRVKRRPFAAPLDSDQSKGVEWVKPQLAASIEYRAWTADGLLRHATFKAMRADKPSAQVTKPDSLL